MNKKVKKVKDQTIINEDVYSVQDLAKTIFLTTFPLKEIPERVAVAIEQAKKIVQASKDN